MKSDESKMNYIKELVEKGNKNGMLTYKEIMDTLEEVEMNKSIRFMNIWKQRV